MKVLKEIVLGVVAQQLLSIQYLTDIVHADVTDQVLAAKVIADLTAKLNAQSTAFVAGIKADEVPAVDLTKPLV